MIRQTATQIIYYLGIFGFLVLGLVGLHIFIDF